MVQYYVGLKVPVWWPEKKRHVKGVITSMSGNLARVLYDDEDVGEALVRPDGKLVEASAYDEREELMEGDEVPEDHPRPILPKRGRPMGSKDKVPRKPRGSASATTE